MDNVFSRGGTLFSQVGNIWGQDLPSKLQLKISYGDIPIHGGGKGLVDRICRHREEFEDVVIIGCDESGIEQTFDFSSVLKHFLIQPTKDENEHLSSCLSPGSVVPVPIISKSLLFHKHFLTQSPVPSGLCFSFLLLITST